MQHDWIPSTLGHGEAMCRRCFVTNREAAVLGMAECDVPSPTPLNDNKPQVVQTLDQAESDYLDNEYDDEDCPQCGNDGFVFECFDGCCKDCDIGCDDCTRPCPECGIKHQPAPAGLSEALANALAANKKS